MIKVDKNSIITILLFVFTLSTGCARKEGGSTTINKQVIDLNLNMKVPSAGSSTVTLKRDQKIDYINLYLFVKKEGNAYKFKEMHIVDKEDISVTENLGVIQYSFSAPVMATDSPVIIYLVANQPGGKVTKLNTVDGEVPESEATFLVSPEDISATLVGSVDNPIPISTKIDLPDGISYKTPDQDVSLLRSMASVDIKKDDLISDSNFKLLGISVWFSPDRGRLVHYAKSARTITKPTMPNYFKILPEDPKDQTNQTISPIRWGETIEIAGIKEIKNKIT